MKSNVIALLAGILFGVGLSLSQMVNPNKVLDFLDVIGRFDPSLMFVMVGALAVTLLSFRQIRQLSTPLFGDKFHLATNKLIDKPLVIGAAVFGIGWGLTGYCPGPAVAGLSLFSLESVVMVIAICVGFLVYHFIFERHK